MRTKHEPQFAKNANQTTEESTPGIRKLKPRLGRPKPYGVQWAHRVWNPVSREEERKIKTEFFSSEASRDKRFDELVAERQRGTFAPATRQEIAEWRAFQAATDGTPWQDVVGGWRAWLQSNGIVTTFRSVRVLAQDYLQRYDKQVTSGQRAKTTYKKVEKHVKRLAEHFGHLAITKVAGADIEDWIDSLEDVESDATFNTYRRDIHAMFSGAVETAELKRNPVASVSLRDELNETVGVLSVEDTAKLLHTAFHYFDERNGHRFRVIAPRIVLETFGGLRHASALRVENSKAHREQAKKEGRQPDINWEDKGITLPKRKLKTKKRFYVTGFPEPMWAWLGLVEDRAWEEKVDAREYRYLKSELFAAAGVPHPKNCLRHGLASYMLAATKNPGLVSFILTHTNQQKLWDHYFGRVTQADGQRFMTLSPEVAAEIVRLNPIQAKPSQPASPPPSAE